jgi:enediyne biosynthesis protein E4
MHASKAASRRSATYVTQLVALVLVVGSYLLVRPSQTTETEKMQLAKHFHFTRSDVPLEQFATGQMRHTHPLHPSLMRICAWVSSTGASVAMADVDGDGLPNDMCIADPRINRLMVMPAPGTGDRYKPFSPDPSPLVVDPVLALPTGAVVGDFNEDGLSDLLVYFWGRTPILYLHKASMAAPGKLCAAAFRPVELVPPDADGKPTRWYTHGATQADVDGDGHVDLVMGNFFRDDSDVLDPNGTGVEQIMHTGFSKALSGGGAKLFMWQQATKGDEPTVKFADMSNVLTDLAPKGWVFAVGAADLDHDMLPEIYYAHDFGPDRMFYNESTPGHPKFALVEGQRSVTTPKSCVLGHDSFKGMGVSFADVNHDGFLDIYVSNIADQMALHESHFVWVSNGRPEEFKHGIAPYTQQSEELGMSRSGWGWDTKFGDFDNDGDDEALQATGMCKGTTNRWPELQELGTSNDRIVSDPRLWPKFDEGTDISGHNVNPFFTRCASGKMVNVSAEMGTTEPYNTRGIAVADVNGDGLLDYAIADQWGPSYFFKNDSKMAGAFVGLNLLLPVAGDDKAEFVVRDGHPSADTPGRPAIGACAALPTVDGKVMCAQIDGGSGHAGRSSPQIHFGLGNAPKDKPIEVKLIWRDAHGQLQNHTINVTPGWHTVILGSPSMNKLSQK